MTSKRYYLKNILSKRNNGEPHSIIPFKGNKIMIGRGLHSNYVIDDISISRSHALFKLSEESGSWTVQNKSSGGIILNNEQIPKEMETDIDIGSIIQFGSSKFFIYRFGMKEFKPKVESKDSSADNVDLNTQHATLELRLRESERIRESLLNDQQHIQESLENEKHLLQQQYNKQYEELERKYSEGVLAQKSVLQEKEILAQLLQCKVTDMQQRIEEEKTNLEEKLRREEATRQRLLEEKDLVVLQLQEEKKALERRLEEERKEMEKRLHEEHQQLREQLVSLKEQRTQLELKVHEKEQTLLEKEEIQLKHEEDQRKTAETLLDEKRQLMSRLQEVESSLEEKIILTSTLTLELKEKEEIEKRLLALQEEKHKLELELHVAAKKGEQISHLEEALNILEAQKMSLEQDAASAAIVSEDVRKQVVENVSNVVENELQCPICNELFVTAIMLNCSHVFCKFCIDSWKKTKKDCPNCRASISTESRAYVLDNFIEKIVLTLSEDTKKRREDMISERTVAELAAKAAEAAAAAARAEAAQGSRRGRNRNNRGGRRGGGYYSFPHVSLPVQNLTTDVVHNNIHIIGPNAYAQNRIVVIPPAAPRPLTNRPTSLLGAPTVSAHLRPVHIIQVGNEWATVNQLRNPGYPAYRMGNPISFHNPSLSGRIATTSSGPNANTIIVTRMHHP